MFGLNKLAAVIDRRQARSRRSGVTIAILDFRTSREWRATPEGRREMLDRLQEAQLPGLNLDRAAVYLVTLTRLEQAEKRRQERQARASAVQLPFDPWSYDPRPCSIVGDSL